MNWKKCNWFLASRIHTFDTLCNRLILKPIYLRLFSKWKHFHWWNQNVNEIERLKRHWSCYYFTLHSNNNRFTESIVIKNTRCTQRTHSNYDYCGHSFIFINYKIICTDAFSSKIVCYTKYVMSWFMKQLIWKKRCSYCYVVQYIQVIGCVWTIIINAKITCDMSKFKGFFRMVSLRVSVFARATWLMDTN